MFEKLSEIGEAFKNFGKDKETEIVDMSNIDMEPCPKCKKTKGYEWHWSSSISKGDGYSECKSCKEKFR